MCIRDRLHIVRDSRSEAAIPSAVHGGLEQMCAERYCTGAIVGVYSPIPGCYSADLEGMIRTLLQLNARRRPSCDDILDAPIVRNKVKELGLSDETLEVTALAGSELLGTIQIPKNLRILRDKLPKPHYYKSLDSPPDTEHIAAELGSLPSVRRNVMLANDSVKRSAFSNAPSQVRLSQKLNPDLMQPETQRRIPVAPIEEEKENFAMPQLEERQRELPEIRRRAPIKRPPPRVQRREYNKPQNEPYNIYSPLNIKRLEERAQPGLGNRKGKLQRVYENIIRQNDLYSLLPRYKVPVVHNVYRNEYQVYKPVHVQPAWWG
eukprot:TRINITY_DN5653_c0_g2_i6.p1 TRINITY_DN5653_c0_g2~~TRINITY_DN5653_c0_g2_i6.p1  ORF type:complete len:320 (-),score=60.54 TRINITY_DN5653_c0_g2_i6:130-1089(-)